MQEASERRPRPISPGRSGKDKPPRRCTSRECLPHSANNTGSSFRTAGFSYFGFHKFFMCCVTEHVSKTWASWRPKLDSGHRHDAEAPSSSCDARKKHLLHNLLGDFLLSCHTNRSAHPNTGEIFVRAAEELSVGIDSNCCYPRSLEGS